MLSANAYWAFTEFMMRQSSTVENAYLWSKIGFLWPFSIALLVHFGFVFTENALLKKRKTYVLIYGPALFFSLIELTTNFISGPPINEYWGYTSTVPQDSWLYVMGNTWAAVLAFFTIFLCVRYYTRIIDPAKKKQAKLISIGLAIPIFMAVITDMIFPRLSITLPGLGNVSSAILSGFVAYAIWKYKLFALTPAIAAEEIISTIPDVLILTNLGQKIIRVNRAFLDLTEYEEKEVIGKSIDELCGINILNELARKKVIKNYETNLTTKSGEKKVAMVSGSIVESKDKKTVGFVWVIHDITERKQLEQKLVKAERFASIGELAGMVGHDLRNPLTSIKGAVYYLKNKQTVGMDVKGKEMLETIEKSINYSNKIINDLLEYSREIKLELIETTPRLLLNNALSLVEIPEGIRVINATEDNPKTKVDTSKIDRVLVNLTKNAFEAMPHGGTLTINSKLAGDDVEISFNDTGTGMTPEVLGKIWNPLFTTKAKGMGFGLSICKRILEAHGGRISVESTVGVGSTFTVTLPIDPKLVDEPEEIWVNREKSGLSANGGK
jgi:PAS domain S-box-containing protein